MTSETQPLRGPLRKRESSLWAREPNDWYVEPEWCSERLFQLESFPQDIWDPAAGMGNIPNSARKANIQAFGSDLNPKQKDIHQFDFFKAASSVTYCIVSNPPFGVAESFVKLALELVFTKTAMLLPAGWVQGDKRSRWLETTPLRRVLFITPRPSMPPGTVVMSGGKPGNGTTDYAWFIWEHGYTGKPEIGWCRK